MAERYLVQFEVDGGSSAVDTLRRLAKKTAAWVNNGLKTAHPEGTPISDRNGRSDWADNDWAQVDGDEIDGAATWALHWEHPDRAGAPYVWGLYTKRPSRGSVAA